MLLAQLTDAAKMAEYAGNTWGFAAFIVVMLILGFGWGAHVWFRDVVKPESAARTEHTERLVKCVEVVTTDIALLKEHARGNTEAIERIDRRFGERPCLTLPVVG